MKGDSFFKSNRNALSREVSTKPAVLTILYRLAMFSPREGSEDSKWIMIKWRDIGLSEQQFRDARDYILRNELATSRGTNKGTFWKLTSKTIFDINGEQKNEQRNGRRTGLYKQEEKNSKQEYINIAEKVSDHTETYQESGTPLQSSAKVSPLFQKVLELGLSYGVNLTVNTSFDYIESKFTAPQILKKAEDMFLWVIDNPKQKASTARLLRFMKNDFGNQKGTRPEFTLDRYKQMEVRGATYASSPLKQAAQILEEKHPDILIQKKVKAWADGTEVELPDDLREAIEHMPGSATKRFCENLVAKKTNLKKTI